MTAPRAAASGPFLRESSGLVREARTADVFIFNTGLISIGIAICLTQSLGAPNYPGASVALACLVAGLMMGAIALGFYAWAVAVPRSGGVYTFISRGLSPSAGFAISLVDSFTWLFYNALAASFVCLLGIAPLALALSQPNSLPHDSSFLIVGSTGQFLAGSSAIVVGMAILLLGMRAFLLAQKVVFALAILGTVATIAILLNTSVEEFRIAYDRFAAVRSALHYDAVAAAGHTTVAFSWGATIKLAVWPILSFVGSIFSIAIGGEVQGASRSQRYGMFGSIAFAVVALVALAVLSNRAFGADFLNGLWTGSGAASALPLPPYLPSLLVVASPNRVLSIVACVGFGAWAFMWIPATIVYACRTVLAWSLDRVAPAALGEVSARLHTPARAVLLVGLLNISLLALFLFTHFFATLILVLAAMLAWLPTMIAGMLFPWRRRRLHEAASVSGIRYLGIPAMSLACGIAFLAAAVLTYLLWTDEFAAGHSAKSLITIGSLFGIGIVYYACRWSWLRARGHDLGRAFEEIPVE